MTHPTIAGPSRDLSSSQAAHAAQATQTSQAGPSSAEDPDRIEVLGPTDTALLSPRLAAQIKSGKAFEMKPKGPAGEADPRLETVQVHMPEPELDAGTRALHERIAAKAVRHQEELPPNREAALEFYKGLVDLDDLPESDRAPRLTELAVKLIHANGYDMAQVSAQTKASGRWSNLQNWVPDVISTTPQALDAILLASGVGPVARAFPNFALSMAAFVSTPLISTYYIQSILELQRMTRPATSVNYGKAADPGPAYRQMREATGETKSLVRQVTANPSDDNIGSLTDRLAELDVALKTYKTSQDNLVQRRTLNMPESQVRMFRAVIFAAAAWANFGLRQQHPGNKVPVVFLVQFFANMLTWLLHWHVAGPKRDERIRNEQLKVDIASQGPEMVKALYTRTTGKQVVGSLAPESIESVDDEAVKALQDMVKDRKEVVIEDGKKLFVAEQNKHFNDLAELLKLSVPDVKEFYTSVQKKAVNERSDNEARKARRVDKQLQALNRSGDANKQKYDAAVRAIHEIDEDVARLDHPDQWVNIASSRQEVLDAVLTDPLTKMSFARIWQYLFDGVKSKDDVIRTAHLLAQDIRSDWRRFAPDAHYKYGKATQVAGMGSAAFPFLQGSLVRIMESLGREVPVGLKIGLSVVPLFVYFLGETYSGNLVNKSIAMRKEMMDQFPHGREPSPARRLVDTKMFFSNSVLVPNAVVTDIVHGLGNEDTHKVIKQAQSVLQQEARRAQEAQETQEAEEARQAEEASGSLRPSVASGTREPEASGSRGSQAA